MPKIGTKALAATAAALLVAGGLVVGRTTKAQAEATTTVIDFEARVHPDAGWSMTAHALVCVTVDGKVPACAPTNFDVPMSPELVDALDAVQAKALVVFDAQQAAPAK